jgi:hypothetical protein
MSRPLVRAIPRCESIAPPEIRFRPAPSLLVHRSAPVGAGRSHDRLATPGRVETDSTDAQRVDRQSLDLGRTDAS